MKTMCVRCNHHFINRNRMQIHWNWLWSYMYNTVTKCNCLLTNNHLGVTIRQLKRINAHVINHNKGCIRSHVNQCQWENSAYSVREYHSSVVEKKKETIKQLVDLCVCQDCRHFEIMNLNILSNGQEMAIMILKCSIIIPSLLMCIQNVLDNCGKNLSFLIASLISHYDCHLWRIFWLWQCWAHFIWRKKSQLIYDCN